MTDSHQREQASGEDSPGQDQATSVSESQDDSGEAAAQQTDSAEASQAETASAETAPAETAHAEADAGQAAEDATTQVETAGSDTVVASAPEAAAGRTQVDTSEGGDTEAQDGSVAQRKGNRKSLLAGIGIGALVALLAAAGVGAFVWPGLHAGPGKPDGKASEVTAALASKNPGELEKVSCHGPDGKSTTQIPPQAVQMIQAAKPAGPTHLALDTEALAPVDITLSAQGQTQNVPADVVLGVTQGQWCMKGISQRQ
jgi:hypothetical protein